MQHYFYASNKDESELIRYRICHYTNLSPNVNKLQRFFSSVQSVYYTVRLHALAM